MHQAVQMSYAIKGIPPFLLVNALKHPLLQIASLPLCLKWLIHGERYTEELYGPSLIKNIYGMEKVPFWDTIFSCCAQVDKY